MGPESDHQQYVHALTHGTYHTEHALQDVSAPGVDEPGSRPMCLHLLGQQLSVLHRVPCKKRRPKAGTECSLGLSDALLSAGNLYGV